VAGLFFQWVSCIAIWMTGFVLYGIRMFPQFYPLAMLGGFLWCTGLNIRMFISVLSAVVIIIIIYYAKRQP